MKTNVNEIKKDLYKKKPIATRFGESNGYVQYNTFLNKQIVEFKIPVLEANFEDEIPAHLLIRWM